MVGTYQIGKEKVVLAIAKEFNIKIFVSVEKYEILSKLNMDMSIFTTCPTDTCVHVVQMGNVNFLSINKKFFFLIFF